MIKGSRNSVRQGFVPATAIAQFVFFDDRMMHVSLMDGRVISIPLSWVPQLEEASPEERELYEIDEGGASIYWQNIGEEVLVANLLAGADSSSN